MELFNVKRFNLNENEDNVDSSQRENHILQKLFQKVKEKEKTYLESKQEDIVDGNEVKNDDEKDSQEEIKQTEDDSNRSDKLLNEDLNKISLEGSGFQILGDYEQQKQPSKKIAMVLPPWIANPVLIPIKIGLETDESNESSLTRLPVSKITYLHRSIKDALLKMNITCLFPVQEVVIPWILKMHSKPPPFRPRDICVSAPTGSGKTLAFAIPIVQQLCKRRDQGLHALIVLPVTELAAQVYRVFVALTKNTDIKVLLLSTQTPFNIEQSNLIECYKNKYYSKVDILITTPGRLVEHIHGTKGFCLKSLKFLVIDEADRIMDEIFQNWLYHVYNHVRKTSNQLLSGQCPPLSWNELETSYDTQPHKLLFSATLSVDPEKIQSVGLFRPKLFTSTTSLEYNNNSFEQQENTQDNREQHNTNSGVVILAEDDTVGRYITPIELTEKYCLTESQVKPLTLFTLIMEHNWLKFLCFTNSISSSERLTYVLKKMLKNNIVISELSTNLKAKDRANILTSFSRGQINGIICSDGLARGIDVPNIDVVISYDPPRHIRTYIHRVGRTARAGRPGTAITLLNEQEQVHFKTMLANVGKTELQEMTISTEKEEQYANDYSAALQMLRKKLIRQKRYKILLKERITAIPKTITNFNEEKGSTETASSRPLTLMEKLQEQANRKVNEVLTNDFDKLFHGKRKINTKSKAKKNKK